MCVCVGGGGDVCVCVCVCVCEWGGCMCATHLLFQSVSHGHVRPDTSTMYNTHKNIPMFKYPYNDMEPL